MNDDSLKRNQRPAHATAVKLLQAASEIVNGDRALAQRLGIDEILLSRFMAGQEELPDPILFSVVDIIVVSHDAEVLLPGTSMRRNSRPPDVDA